MYVSGRVPGVGGVLKVRPEDFLVEEIPLIEPAGTGDHIWMFIEKRMLATTRMVEIIARHFRLRPVDIGVAGLKDKHAMTRQVVSVHLPGKETGEFLDHPQIGVLWVDRHTHKLKRGQLRGNRFSIRIRRVSLAGLPHARDALHALARAGVPNRFGHQRFGYMGNNHLIGRAMLLGDHALGCDLLLGPSEDPQVAQRDGQHDARLLYAQGDLRGARAAFHASLRLELRVLGSLVRGDSPGRALGTLRKRERGFYLTAFQSAIFNRVLDQRLGEGSLDRLFEGDITMDAQDRSLDRVEPGSDRIADLRKRLGAFELSPTGPMWGPGMVRAGGAVDEREVAQLGTLGLSPEQVQKRSVPLEGERRPLRVRLGDPQIDGGMDEHGAYIRCAFDLPRGSFATMVMEEIMKNGRAGEIGMYAKEDA